MLIDIGRKADIGKKELTKEEAEIQARVDRAVDLAQRSLKEIQRQSRIYKTRGEKQPHFLEQMSLAYANAISHYQAFKLLQADGMTLDQAKENATELLRIAFSHLELKYDPKPEEKEEANVNH